MSYVGKYKYDQKFSLKTADDFKDKDIFVSGSVLIPDTADLRPWCSAVEDQGRLGSCGPNASTGAMELLYNKLGIPFAELSRLFLYKNTRNIMGTSQDDSGVDNASMFKAAKDFGVCPEKEWPYDISKFKKTPPVSCYKSALKRQLTQYARLESLNEIMEAVGVKKVGVVIATTVYSSFESDEVAKTGMVPVPDTRKEKNLGGHDMLIVGYDKPKRLLLVRNSWSDAWGIKGYCWIPFEYVEKGIANEFWAVLAEETGEDSVWVKAGYKWAKSVFSGLGK